jgi:predicted nuclease of predicted toxin-antitoxin system
VKFKLDENLPVSATSVLAAAGHDVDTVPGEHLAGRPDQDVVVASTTAQRVLISLDVGLGDIRPIHPAATPAS